MKTLKIYSSVATVLLLLLFQDCKLIDDDSVGEVCSVDCTTIQGRFTSEDGTPIPDIPLELDWEIGPSVGIGLGGKVRKIFKSATDQNGHYRFQFHPREEELTSGRFVVRFITPVGLSPINPSENHFELYEVTKIDTTVNADYHIAKRGGRLGLKIRNPEAMSSTDRISAYLSFKTNLNQMQFEGVGTYDPTMNSESIFETAANQLTFIKIFKKEGDQYSIRMDSIFVPFGETKVYEVEF